MFYEVDKDTLVLLKAAKEHHDRLDPDTPRRLVALGTGALPKWVGLVGFLLALVAFLHFAAPLVGTLANLVWVALVSALMLVGLGALSRPDASPTSASFAQPRRETVGSRITGTLPFARTPILRTGQDPSPVRARRRCS